MNMMKCKSAKGGVTLRDAISYGASFVFPLFTKMMENPKKSLHRTSGSANSSRVRYLDKAGPKEEANL